MKKSAKRHEQDPINRQLGERLRRLRASRDWSLDALATSSGVSRSMLSEIERNKANPTLMVAYRIARAFNMTLGELVESPGNSPTIQTVRANDRGQILRADKLHHIRTLSPLNLDKAIEFYEILLPVGGELRSQAHVEGTRELLVVARGLVRIESGRDVETLEAGDSAAFRADVAHAIINSGKGDAMIYLVDIYR
jgi:transcriptional regulator with XRE-family HTH domain